MAATPNVLIVGAGLAGLACARRLTNAGLACTVLEASDGVGGVSARIVSKDFNSIADFRSSLPDIRKRGKR